MAILGAFVQGTYDKAAQHTYLDNTDIRYADTTQIGGIDVLYGLDVNNGPTVQDVWNTTPAWGFPYVASTLAPAFAPPGTQIESGFGGRSVGTGAYVFIHDMLYLEASAYNNLSKGELNAIGQPCANNSDYVQNVQAWAAQNYPPNQPYSIACPSNSLASASPYWRVALEPSWGDHTLMIGAFGFYPQVLPGRVMGYGVDFKYRDIGLDAQYQYINDVHALTLKVSRISETQNFQATFAQGVAGQAINALGIVNAFGLPPVTGNASSNPTNHADELQSLGGLCLGSYDQRHGRLFQRARYGGRHAVRQRSSGPVRSLRLWLAGRQGADLRHRLYAFQQGELGSIRGPTPRWLVLYALPSALWRDDQFRRAGTYYNGNSWRSHTATDNDTLFLLHLDRVLIPIQNPRGGGNLVVRTEASDSTHFASRASMRKRRRDLSR